MAVLKSLSVTIVVMSSFAIACYSPDAPDCALACTADTDCISGQACTTDHLCAASGITTCGAHAVTDGGAGATADAAEGSGSGGTVTLMIHVDKGGGVRLSTNQLCDTGINTMATDCMYDVPAGKQLTATAYAHIGFQFDKWDGMPCMGQGTTCTFTLTMMNMINAKFKN